MLVELYFFCCCVVGYLYIMCLMGFFSEHVNEPGQKMRSEPIRPHYVNIASGSFFGVVFCSCVACTCLFFCKYFFYNNRSHLQKDKVVQVRWPRKKHDKKTGCNNAGSAALAFWRRCGRVCEWGFLS